MSMKVEALRNIVRLGIDDDIDMNVIMMIMGMGELMLRYWLLDRSKQVNSFIKFKIYIYMKRIVFILWIGISWVYYYDIWYEIEYIYIYQLKYI